MGKYFIQKETKNFISDCKSVNGRYSNGKSIKAFWDEGASINKCEKQKKSPVIGLHRWRHIT